MGKTEIIKDWARSNYSSHRFFERSIKKNLSLRNLLGNVKLFFSSGEFRGITYLKFFKSNEVHQTTPFTKMDRYPEIFSACRDYLINKKDLKILSYGCSTGEEVLTLRKYFKDANIVGAEINKNSLKVCRSHKIDNKIKFIASRDSNIKKEGKFNLIFCMAVLQRTPHYVTSQGIKNIKDIYPFDKFEKKVNELDSYLNKGGIMVIHYSQYSFTDTEVSSKYMSLGNYNQDDYVTAIFDRDSNLIEKPISRNNIFLKLED